MPSLESVVVEINYGGGIKNVCTLLMRLDHLRGESMTNCGDFAVRTTRPNSAMLLARTALIQSVLEIEVIGNVGLNI